MRVCPPIRIACRCIPVFGRIVCLTVQLEEARGQPAGLNRMTPRKKGVLRKGAAGRLRRLLIDALRELGWRGLKAGGALAFAAQASFLCVRFFLPASWSHGLMSQAPRLDPVAFSGNRIRAWPPLGSAVFANRRGETLSVFRPIPSQSALKPVTPIFLMPIA